MMAKDTKKVRDAQRVPLSGHPILHGHPREKATESTSPRRPKGSAYGYPFMGPQRTPTQNWITRYRMRNTEPPQVHAPAEACGKLVLLAVGPTVG